MFFFPDEAMSPDIQWFKDVVRTKDKLLYQKVAFFPGEIMSPDMQYFKNVVRTRDKSLYRKVAFFPGEAMSPDMQCFKDVVLCTKDKLLYRKRYPCPSSLAKPCRRTCSASRMW